MAPPDNSFELEVRSRGLVRIAGIDEVGRGPLAGPVLAAAVILPESGWPDGLDDSKAICAAERTRLAAEIEAVAETGFGIASVEEIDRLNILGASLLAMSRAVAALRLPPDHVLVDGPYLPSGLCCPGGALVKGDARSVSIAAASIVAKVRRDAIMVDLAQQHPGYGWERNAGYPTKGHREALQILGVTPHHRRSFQTVRNILYQEEMLNP